MLTLTAARDAVDPLALQTAGGFGWWYADIVDADGNGVVIIAGEGMPFLPGIASSARAGVPVLPSSRPSLNVAVYERGVCTFYALQELPVEASSRLAAVGATGRVVFGTSAIEFSTDTDDVAGGLAIVLDVTLPVGRLRGEVHVDGPRRQHTSAWHDLGADHVDFGDVSHRWAPQLGPARGRARLEIDGRDVVIEGSGYHDRNSARRPLHGLGIDHWVWGRAEVVVDGRRQVRIIYALWPENAVTTPAAFGVIVDDLGATTVVPVTIALDMKGTWLGMRDVRRLVATTADGTSFLVGEVAARVDDGPFYLRSIWRAGVDAAGADCTGYVEVVEPHAVDKGWQRPFVKMKVTPSSPTQASLWHPLFAGPRAGRVRRQLRWLVGNRQ